jgi:hypothetical protein
MVDGADEGLRRIARQFGVGVQRDHVLHRRQRLDVADNQHEAVVRIATKWQCRISLLAAQQRVEIGQLAALALVPHPALLGHVPAAWPMEQEEAIGIVAGVVLVERLDASLRQPQQRVVAGQGLAVRIGEVGEQGEMQMFVAVAEEAHFQRLDQILDILRAGEQAGDRHQRACTGRDAVRVIHPRQLLW